MSSKKTLWNFHLEKKDKEEEKSLGDPISPTARKKRKRRRQFPDLTREEERGEVQWDDSNIGREQN